MSLFRSPMGSLAWITCFAGSACTMVDPAAQTAKRAAPVTTDYLLDPSPFAAKARRSPNGKELHLENGLVRRTWRLAPNGACIAFDNLMTGQSMLRSVRPEARVTIDGQPHDVGGLTGQPNHAYLTTSWLDAMQASPSALQLVGTQVSKPRARFAWGQSRHSAADAAWPPKGVHLRMDYALPAAKAPAAADTNQPQFRVAVHYELYDGIPAMSKWITVHNDAGRTIRVERFTAEELALVEQANWVETRGGVTLPRPEYLHVETDFAFGGFNHHNANRHAVHWRRDPLYTSQVNYKRETPCLLVCEPTYGPGQQIPAGAIFESFRIFELAYDRGDRERRGLALRQMYRRIAPWVTENPITHHLLSHDPKRIMQAIDEAAEVGFEAIILSFGSGFNMENRDPEFLEQWRRVANYAKKKGIELGSYSLFSSRGVGASNMIVSPPGQRPTHGKCPAVTSPWGQEWLATIRGFYEATGFQQFENDGPYPGDVDVTARPPLQAGIQDSRWAQWRLTTGLYRDLRANGVYINAPDYYYLSGSNKCGMGYREVNWSLPRAHQVIHTRQNIYDGTWTKTPSMGWMFVPLTQYHGGGKAATIEPLHQHIEHYETMMRSNLGMGVQAHYRGPRLFDTPATKDMVKTTVAWFQKHRAILESDIIHGRRADGRDLDWVLHVNPQLQDKGMLCVYNPLDKDVTKTIRVNLYYTGLTTTAHIRANGSKPVRYALGRDDSIDLDVSVPAKGMSWYLIR